MEPYMGTKSQRDEETKRGSLPQPLPKGKGFVAALMHRTWGLLGRLRDKETKSQKVKETKRLREEEWERGRDKESKRGRDKNKGEQKTLQTLHKTLHSLRISLTLRMLHCVGFEAKILHKPYMQPYMGTKRQRD